MFLSLLFIFSLLPYLFSGLGRGGGELTARNRPHITLPPFPSVSPASPAPTEERKIMPSNWYKGTFCFYAAHAKRRGKKEGGKNPLMLKREREILPAVVLSNPGSQSAPHFLLEVRHRPRPNSALGGSSCWSEKNRPWRLDVTLKGRRIHHFVYKRACAHPLRWVWSAEAFGRTWEIWRHAARIQKPSCLH